MNKDLQKSPRTLRQAVETVARPDVKSVRSSDFQLIEESKKKYRNFVDTVNRASDRDMERSLARS